MDDQTPNASPRAVIAAFLIVALAIGGGMALLLSTRPDPVVIRIVPPAAITTSEAVAEQGETETTAPPSPTPAPITVYVTGAVASPGVLSLPHDSRVQDALNAAGGTAANADLARVNLAAPLHDGDQIHVPAVQEAPIETATPTDARIRINSATLEELMTLPGIGEATAGAILAYRDANGPFADATALDAVEGIGPATLEELAPLIRFD